MSQHRRFASVTCDACNSARVEGNVLARTEQEAVDVIEVVAHARGWYVDPLLSERICARCRTEAADGTPVVRVEGHDLIGEGAPYKTRAGKAVPARAGWRSGGTDGRGFCVCSCGERSTVMRTGADRREWHRAHRFKIGYVEQVLQRRLERGWGW